jgi:hypothetical protein
MDMMNIKFELEDVDGKITKEFTADDMESWAHIILKCADFLSAQYGYGISEKVLFITDYPCGREVDHAISKNEYALLLSARNREKDLFSDWGDDE